MKHMIPRRNMKRGSLWLVGAALIIAALACSVSADRRETPPTLTQIALEAGQSAEGEEVAEEEATEETTDEEGEGSVPDEAPGSGAIATDTPTPTPEPGVTPSATPCLYNAKFESDVTIPDGTEIVAGEAFTKTWRLRNNGCQAWPSGTQLVFLDGNQMSGPAGVPVPQTATQGQQDISVNLVAPTTPGSHQGLWQLRTPDGIAFGDKIYVDIVVLEPTATPTATLTSTPTLTPTATSGGIIILPVFFVDFTAGYAGTWNCGSFGRINFRITNTGNTNIESMNYYIEGPIGTYVNSASQNAPFRSSPTAGSPDCNQTGETRLEPDEARWVWAVGTRPAGSGVSGKAILKMCSQDNLGGICDELTITFTY